MGKIGRPKKYYMTPRSGSRPVRMVKLQPVVGNMTTFGEWLKMHMDEMEVTQDWLAWKTDVAASSVQKWVSGRSVPKIKPFLRTCRLLALATKRPFTDILLEAADCVDNQACR